MAQNLTAERENTQHNNGITSKVVGGSLWNIGGQMAVMTASLLATSFVIRLLGTELYGVWALIVLIIGYATQGDFGMGIASTRFGSQAFAQDDGNGESRIIWTAFGIAMIPSLLVSASLLIFAKPLINDALKIPVYLQSQAYWALVLAAFCFTFRVAGNIFNTPQIVRLRMDINASIVSGLIVLQVLITPLAIWMWGGLFPAAVTVTVCSFLTLILLFIASQRLLPGLKHPKIDFTLAKPMIRFGGSLLLSSAAGIILGTIEKPLLARYASVTTLAHYAVATTLANVMSVFPIAVSQSLLPAFTRLYTSGDKTALKALYNRAIRGNLLWVLPMAFFLCIIAKPFFTLWAGEEFGRAATTPLYILVVGLVIDVFSYVPYILLQASGRATVIMKIYWLQMIPYILLLIFLTSFYGAEGAAAGLSLKILIDAVIFFLFIKPILGTVSDSFLSIGIWYWGAASFCIIAAFLLVNFVSSLILLALFSIGVIILYFVIILTKILKSDEKAWISFKIKPLWVSVYSRFATEKNA